MATQGPLTWFNKALQRINDANLAGHTFKAILVTTTQTFDENFVGSSGDALYSDITAELATANGYTSGGLTLTNPTISLVSGVVKWVTDAFFWTLSGTVNFRWLVIYDSTDGELVAFADMDTSGATNITATAGVLGFTPNPSSSAWLTWDQP